MDITIKQVNEHIQVKSKMEENAIEEREYNCSNVIEQDGILQKVPELCLYQ